MKTMLLKFNEAQEIDARTQSLEKYRCPNCGDISPQVICYCDIPKSKIIKRPIQQCLQNSRLPRIMGAWA